VNQLNDLMSRSDSDVLGEASSMFVDGECALYYYPSAPSLGRCMPTLSSDAETTNNDLAFNNMTISENSDDVMTFDELNER